jgi:hypothetical protein
MKRWDIKKSDYRILLIFPYIQIPTTTIIAKTISMMIIGARISIRKTMIEIITISAIIPTIIVLHPKLLRP